MNVKLLTTAALAALVMSSSAFASIARQAVMGGQPIAATSAGTSAIKTSLVNGSLWYDEDYNVFYNPALVMDSKNYVVVEKGKEGGFFKSMFDNFAYGVYVNRGGGTANANYGDGLTSVGINSNSAYGVSGVNTQRPVDLFIAGDTGVKWGFHVAWAYNKDETVATTTKDVDNSARYWHFDLGAQVMGLEPFVGATLFTKAQNGINAQEQTLDEFNVGVRYKYEGWTPYFAFKKYREGAGPGNLASTRMLQTRVNMWGFGVSHDTKVADGVHFLKHVGFYMNSYEDDTGATESVKDFKETDFKETIIPVNFDLEAEATSWLTLRAGARYDFINTRKFARSNATPAASVNDKVQSQAGTVTARIGSTLKFGKLHVDSAFGTGSADTSATAAGIDGRNAGFDSQTFALVSASYRW